MGNCVVPCVNGSGGFTSVEMRGGSSLSDFGLSGKDVYPGAFNTTYLDPMQIELCVLCDNTPSVPKGQMLFMCYKIDYFSKTYKWADTYKHGEKPKETRSVFIDYTFSDIKTVTLSVYITYDATKVQSAYSLPPIGMVTYDIDSLLFETQKPQLIGEKNKIVVTVIASPYEKPRLSKFNITAVASELKLSSLSGLQFQIIQKKGEKVTKLYESPIARRAEEELKDTDKKNYIYQFNKIKFNKNFLENSDKLFSTKMYLELFEVRSNGDKEPLGLKLISLKEMIDLWETDHEVPIAVYSYNRKKYVGKFTITKIDYTHCINILSRLHSGLKIVPIVAIDYSLGNLTFDNSKCIHHFRKTEVNDYGEALKSITNAFRNFSESAIGYGFGAKPYPKDGTTSDCFAINQNYFNPFLENGVTTLVDDYYKCLKQVELVLPVNWSKIVEQGEHISNIYNNSKSLPVLIILTAGVIDDHEESVAEFQRVTNRASNGFLLIYIVKMGKYTIKDIEELVKKVKAETGKRDIIEIIEYNDFKDKPEPHNIGYTLLKKTLSFYSDVEKKKTKKHEEEVVEEYKKADASYTLLKKDVELLDKNLNELNFNDKEKEEAISKLKNNGTWDFESHNLAIKLGKKTAQVIHKIKTTDTMSNGTH